MNESFEAGQQWTYLTRANEGDSRARVARVDATEHAGIVIHFVVDQLRIANPSEETGFTIGIGFMPMSEEAARRSVFRLEADGVELPGMDEFEDTYSQWRPAFEQGNAGIWTVPITDVIATLQRGFQDQ